MKRLSRNRYRALGLLVVAAMAFSAVAAASASALTWATKTGGVVTKFTNGQEETVTPSIKAATEFVLEGTVGSTPIKISAKKLSGESTKIKQEGTAAKDSGKLIFSELKLSEPATCTPPEKITTSALKSELVTKTKGALRTEKELSEGKEGQIPSGLTDKFQPAEGEVFASFKLGGSCAIAGTVIQVKTSKGLYAETNPLATYTPEQPLKFSPLINANAGGNLFTGANPAKLTGEGVNTLSGALAGKEWGAE